MFYQKEDLEIIIQDYKLFAKEIAESNGVVIQELKTHNICSINKVLDLYQEIIKKAHSPNKDEYAEKANKISYSSINLWGELDVNELSDKNKCLIMHMIAKDKCYIPYEANVLTQTYDKDIAKRNEQIMSYFLNNSLFETKDFEETLDCFGKESGVALEVILDNIQYFSYDISNFSKDKSILLKLINKNNIGLNNKISFTEKTPEDVLELIDAYENILLDDNIKEDQYLYGNEINLSYFIKNNLTKENSKDFRKISHQMNLMNDLIIKLKKLSNEIDDNDEDIEIIKTLQTKLIDIAIKVDKNNLAKDFFKSDISPNLLTYQLSIAGIINQKSYEFLNETSVNPPLFVYKPSTIMRDKYLLDDMPNFSDWGNSFPFGKDSIPIEIMNKENFLPTIKKINEFSNKFQGKANHSTLKLMAHSLREMPRTQYFKDIDNDTLTEISSTISLDLYTFDEIINVFRKIAFHEIPEVKTLNKFYNNLFLEIETDSLSHSNELELFTNQIAFLMFPLSNFKHYDNETMPYNIALFNLSLNKLNEVYISYKKDLEDPKSSQSLILIKQNIIISAIENLYAKIHDFGDEMIYIDKEKYISCMKNVDIEKIISLYDIMYELNTRQFDNIINGNVKCVRVPENKLCGMNISKINKALEPITKTRIQEYSFAKILGINSNFLTEKLYTNSLLRKKISLLNIDEFGIQNLAMYVDKLLASNLDLTIKKDQIQEIFRHMDVKYNFENDKITHDLFRTLIPNNKIVQYMKECFSIAYDKEGLDKNNLMQESELKNELVNVKAREFLSDLFLDKDKEDVVITEDIINVFIDSYWDIVNEKNNIDMLNLKENELWDFVKEKTIHYLLANEDIISELKDILLTKGQSLLNVNFIDRKFIYAKEYGDILAKIFEDKDLNSKFEELHDFIAGRITDDMYEASSFYLANKNYGFNGILNLSQTISVKGKTDMFFGDQIKNYKDEKVLAKQIKDAVKKINKNREILVEKLNKKITTKDLFELTLYETSLFSSIINKNEIKNVFIKAEPFIEFLDDILKNVGKSRVLEEVLEAATHIKFKENDVKKIIKHCLDNVLIEKDNKIYLLMNYILNHNESGSLNVANYIVDEFPDHTSKEMFFKAMVGDEYLTRGKDLSDKARLEMVKHLRDISYFTYNTNLGVTKENVEYLFSMKNSKTSGEYALLEKMEKKASSSIVKVMYENSVFGKEIKELYLQLKEDKFSKYFNEKIMGMVLEFVIKQEVLPHICNHTHSGAEYLSLINREDLLIMDELLGEKPKSMKLFNDLKEKMEEYFVNIMSSGSSYFMINNFIKDKILEKYSPLINKNISENAYSYVNNLEKVIINKYGNQMYLSDHATEFLLSSVERNSYTKEAYSILYKAINNLSLIMYSRFREGEMNENKDIFKFVINIDYSKNDQVLHEKNLLQKLKDVDKEETVKRKKKI